MSERHTQFDYLLNAFEQASQSDEPAQQGYAAKRGALLAHVRELEADRKRLDILIDWLGHHDTLERSGIRDWNDNADARAAIDGSVRKRSGLRASDGFGPGGMSGARERLAKAEAQDDARFCKDRSPEETE